MRKWLAFALAWALILGGSFGAHRVQTSGGAVKVSEVRIPAGQGVTVSGLLYTPKGATAARPAPAVLVSHGYINTREMQSPFAIELSRRGFVVLAMDMTGHGYSGGIVGTADFGGPAALRYLRALPFVDRANIGMEGHSMGGGPVMAAAADIPDGYRSIVLEGSTPGLLGAKAPVSPKNLAVVFGQYDEFAGLMWGVPKGSEVAASKKLQALFGTAGPVQEGRLYGSVADGTARILANPPVTHPWEHFSSAGVGDAVDWFQRTLPTPAPKAPSDQVWLGKEIGTLVAFVGMVGLILATFDLLLDLPVFARLAQAPEPAVERRDGRWLLSLAITAALPALTYFPLMKVGQVFFPNPAFPQWIQNQLLVWALGTALLSLVVGLFVRRKAAFTNRWGLSIAAAVATMAMAYLSLVLVDQWFKTDYRFWVLGLKPLDAARSMQLPGYLILWSVFFLIAIRSFCASIPVRGEGLLTAVSWGKVAMALGFGVLVAWEYATLFATGLLATPTEPLNVIVAIQFVPLLGVVGIIAAWTYRRTNSYVPGALICAILISWYVTSGTANHWQPGFTPQLPGAAAKR
ncbi:alpha/beta fold hydrolase [Phenylobacterium sp.]|uniref:alpha/beta hydrolase n=1 Tax=Phenylobacterium sp. TaxID=1871053 RepID=UPI0025FBE2E1|nr:alpha/beta fold hydrolase [Phenylobacterium sp.]